MAEPQLDEVLHCANSICGSGNSIAVIESANFAEGTTLALDAAGNPVIAYVVASGGLHVAHCCDPNCTGSVSIAKLPTFGATSIGGARHTGSRCAKVFRWPIRAKPQERRSCAGCIAGTQTAAPAMWVPFIGYSARKRRIPKFSHRGWPEMYPGSESQAGRLSRRPRIRTGCALDNS
jgi:hypothetical protein